MLYYNLAKPFPYNRWKMGDVLTPKYSSLHLTSPLPPPPILYSPILFQPFNILMVGSERDKAIYNVYRIWEGLGVWDKPN